MADFIEQHGAEDHEAEHDLLRVALDVREVHPVLDHRDGEGARQRAEHPAFASAEARAADDDGFVATLLSFRDDIVANHLEERVVEREQGDADGALRLGGGGL